MITETYMPAAVYKMIAAILFMREKEENRIKKTGRKNKENEKKGPSNHLNCIKTGTQKESLL